MSSYDTWKTTEPLDNYPSDAVECEECGRMNNLHEWKTDGCEHCGAPPPEDDEEEDTEQETQGENQPCE